MRKKQYLLILFTILLMSSNMTIGESNKVNSTRVGETKHNNSKSIIDRGKRSLNLESEKQAQTKLDSTNFMNYDPAINYDNFDIEPRFTKSDHKTVNEPPFWGTRGRRTHSLENYFGEIDIPRQYFSEKCKHCYKSSHDFYDQSDSALEDGGDPENNNIVLLKGRDRRQDEDPKFWGSRGKREDLPFWGNRGRRQYIPFSFIRDLLENTKQFRKNDLEKEDEPFWGNRGRREETEPFWGNRGRRQDSEPFWGSRGRRESMTKYEDPDEPFWGNRGRRHNLKQSLQNAIDDIEEDIKNFSHFNKPDFPISEKSSSLVSKVTPSPANVHMRNIPKKRVNEYASTVYDDRMYAEQPGYVVVQRSSRSSGEEDPYFISRGKKKSSDFNMFKAVRDRRGTFEEIVKSVRNDPYYIVRGKKEFNRIKNNNNSESEDELIKIKELICSTVELMMIKNKGKKFKREVDDRDRRNMLKKLAAQLQQDPYFVSRGKKNENSHVKEEYLEAFLNKISAMCN